MIRIGQQFLEERRRQELSLEQVSKATKIREEFLSAIERGEYKKLPSAAYAHGFVRNYAKFLGLPVEKSLAIFRREFDEKKVYDVLPKGFSRSSEFKLRRFRLGRSVFLTTVILIVIALFLLFQYRSAIFNPSIKVDSPKEGASTTSLTVQVSGSTDPNSTLTIDGEAVSVNDDGSFKKNVTVFPGSNTIDFKVENKFGKSTVLERHLTVKQGY